MFPRVAKYLLAMNSDLSNLSSQIDRVLPFLLLIRIVHDFNEGPKVNKRSAIHFISNQDLFNTLLCYIFGVVWMIYVESTYTFIMAWKAHKSSEREEKYVTNHVWKESICIYWLWNKRFLMGMHFWSVENNKIRFNLIPKSRDFYKSWRVNPRNRFS